MMAERDTLALRDRPAEVLQERPSSLRRSRPPDIMIVEDEKRLPLRAATSLKRESKLGLRNIFGRSKSGRHLHADGPSSLRETSRSGIRASLADIGNWSYRLHPSRSEASLLTSLSPLPRPSSALGNPPDSAKSTQSSQSRQSSSGKDKPLPLTPQKAKAAARHWEAPPLFQAYPQAVKHATLPTFNKSVDALARMSEAKNNILSHSNLSQSTLSPDQAEFGVEKKSEAARKKLRVKGAFEWTSKIYVLVTSGYLLQYAAEGNHDRAPEKILQLSSDSAAFASDLIPGKHWVLQVASSTDSDGNPSHESKSLRSKLSIRGVEKRQVSNMLLVCNTPEDMDDWLAILRQEIESLGGRKKLSETGTPETNEAAARLRTQTSQRTLVVRDPDRFSRISTHDFSYTQENALVGPAEDDYNISGPWRASESTLDDGSTASLVSADGQNLDNLRENRFSFMSYGQRTTVTSAGSSPAGSPNRVSFSSQGEDQCGPSAGSDVCMRPNAAAIAERRQSMQTVLSGHDPQTDGSIHRHSVVSTGSSDNGHFSVPYTANVRLSSQQAAAPESVTIRVSPPSDHDSPAKTARRPPPRALAMSRPLSVVVDQPSPISPRSPKSASRAISPVQDPFVEEHESPSPSSSRTSKPCGQPTPGPYAFPKRRSSLLPGRLESETCAQNTSSSENFEAPECIPRSASSLGSYGPSRRLSATPVKTATSAKRSSYQPDTRRCPDFKFPFSAYNKQGDLPRSGKTKGPASSKCAPRRSATSLRPDSTSQSLGVGMPSKALLSRRSMPQLAEGPPPAPPPTCALPPIPTKYSNTTRGIRA
ncbi:hypothetical protein F4780DRAFT_590864 [Xylariomycetidae sp. FL0641]|nr:hypothetical protein F4780DRAFT_590864 [Xylariomycetidae sp. FL0641]